MQPELQVWVSGATITHPSRPDLAGSPTSKNSVGIELKPVPATNGAPCWCTSEPTRSHSTTLRSLHKCSVDLRGPRLRRDCQDLNRRL